MINIIKNFFIFILYLFIACIKLPFMFFCSIYSIIKSDFEFEIIIAILYQPLLIIITTLFFSKPITKVINDFFIGQGNIIYAILLGLVLITSILLLNAFFELFYRIINKGISFETFFNIHKYAHNYIIAIISLLAIYFAINTSNAKEYNIMLLVYGILFFICMIITDIYKEIFLDNKFIIDIYNELYEQYNTAKNKMPKKNNTPQ